LNARRSNDPSRGIRDTRAYAIARDESYIMQLQIPIELIIADLFFAAARTIYEIDEGVTRSGLQIARLSRPAVVQRERLKIVGLQLAERIRLS
jgi:hypothetical protein